MVSHFSGVNIRSDDMRVCLYKPHDVGKLP
jgi:hypothetical protein